MIDVLMNIKFTFFIVFFTVFFILEFFFSQRQTNKKLLRLFFHSLFAIFNTILMRIPGLFLVLPVLLISNEGNFGLLKMLDVNFIIQAIIGFLILDLSFYWLHRLNHTNDFLWRFHRVHHLDTQMDVTTSLRFHIVELLISSVLKTVLILSLGLPISVFIFYEIILSLSAQFHHSDIRLSDKADTVLSYFIVTPKYHTNHHTVSMYSRNANYSSIFTVWDNIFGSRKGANEVDRDYLGVNDRTKEFGFFINLKEPFVNK